MTWTETVLSGAIGLVGAVIITGLSITLIHQAWLPVLLSNAIAVWGLFFLLGLFSVAEIPVMIFGMRQILRSPRPQTRYVVMVANAGYVLFGAVYAAPFILLTGQLIAGLLLALLSGLRLASSIIFLSETVQLPKEKPNAFLSKPE